MKDTIYFGSWSGYEEMLNSFKDLGYNKPYRPLEDPIPLENEVLFASYGGVHYEGNAVVIFKKDGALYEVAGDHCSCNGLEGQWGPDRVSWKALALRLDGMKNGYGFLSSHEGSARIAFKNLVKAHLVEND